MSSQIRYCFSYLRRFIRQVVGRCVSLAWLIVLDLSKRYTDEINETEGKLSSGLFVSIAWAA